jgi:hypothetical protein
LRCAVALLPERKLKGKGELRVLSAVTELISCVVFYFSNIGEIINKAAIFTVVLSTQREQNAKREHRFHGNMGT